jgi:hypothetical protein
MKSPRALAAVSCCYSFDGDETVFGHCQEAELSGNAPEAGRDVRNGAVGSVQVGMEMFREEERALSTSQTQSIAEPQTR